MISNQKDNAINIERPRFETLWATTSKLKMDIMIVSFKSQINNLLTSMILEEAREISSKMTFF